jgi:hypothetical protein
VLSTEDGAARIVENVHGRTDAWPGHSLNDMFRSFDK